MPEQKPVPDRSSLSPRRSKRQVLPGKHAQADGLQLRSYDVGALPLLKRIVERMQLRRILSEQGPILKSGDAPKSTGVRYAK